MSWVSPHRIWNRTVAYSYLFGQYENIFPRKQWKKVILFPLQFCCNMQILHQRIRSAKSLTVIYIYSILLCHFTTLFMYIFTFFQMIEQKAINISTFYLFMYIYVRFIGCTQQQSNQRKSISSAISSLALSLLKRIPRKHNNIYYCTFFKYILHIHRWGQLALAQIAHRSNSLTFAREKRVKENLYEAVYKIVHSIEYLCQSTISVFI